jgi:hypothetical protein
VILVETEKASYFQTILKSIEDVRAQGRPVLVVFKSETELEEFQKHEYGQRIGGANELTEKTLNVDFYVKKATERQAVTFLPKIFGRGLDFVVRDQEVNAKGGVHVIQTFFSGERSEEVQIKGRTARQGKPGSYTMILLDSDVAVDLQITTADVAKESKTTAFFNFLDTTREALIANRIQALEHGCARAKEVHELAMWFRTALVDGCSQKELYSFINKLQE